METQIGVNTANRPPVVTSPGQLELSEAGRDMEGVRGSALQIVDFWSPEL